MKQLHTVRLDTRTSTIYSSLLSSSSLALSISFLQHVTQVKGGEFEFDNWRGIQRQCGPHTERPAAAFLMHKLSLLSHTLSTTAAEGTVKLPIAKLHVDG